MITAAIALAAIPAAATAWIATLTGAFCVAYYLGSGTLEPERKFARRVGMATGLEHLLFVTVLVLMLWRL